jgi:hypothetical protein
LPHRRRRVRDPRAVNYGRWYIVDGLPSRKKPEANQIIAGDKTPMLIKDVERWVMQPRRRRPMDT